MTSAKRTSLIILISLAVIVFFFARIQTQNNQNSVISKKMAITASFYPLAYVAEQIGGNKVSVFTITPSGAEPHDYEPSPQDIAKITESRVLILNGRNLEPWGNDIKQNIDPTKTEIITAIDAFPSQNISEKGKKMIDPHIWQDPIMTKQVAGIVERAFEKADPKNTDAYTANLAVLDAKLDVLDQDFRTGLANCVKKDIVTSHAAFGYLATRYGFTQISIAGLSPDAEPSPKQLADIVTFAKNNNVKYIFFESLASPKLSQTIANEIGAKTLVLNPIEGLTEQERTQGKDYLSIMRENLANLKIALSCT